MIHRRLAELLLNKIVPPEEPKDCWGECWDTGNNRLVRERAARQSTNTTVRHALEFRRQVQSRLIAQRLQWAPGRVRSCWRVKGLTHTEGIFQPLHLLVLIIVGVPAFVVLRLLWKLGNSIGPLTFRTGRNYRAIKRDSCREPLGWAPHRGTSRGLDRLASDLDDKLALTPDKAQSGKLGLDYSVENKGESVIVILKRFHPSNFVFSHPARRNDGLRDDTSERN